MVIQFRCLCCAAVWFACQFALAADGVVEPGRPEKPQVVDHKTADGAADSLADSAAERDTSESEPAETHTQLVAPQVGAPSGTVASWEGRVGEYLFTNPFVDRIFPLSLFARVNQLVGLFQASERAELPTELVRIQLSRQFVEEYFQRAIERDEVVDDTILGTKIDGRGHLSGAVRLMLEPSDDQIRFDLLFTGVCHSKTTGVNDVVVVQNTAETKIQARKHFVWQSEALTASPATATAETHSATSQIGSTLPGLRGWVVTQFAEQRVAESRPQADAISAQHTVTRVQKNLDARVDRSLAWARIISQHLPTSSFIRRATWLRLSSTPDVLQIVVRRRDARRSDEMTPPVELPANCDVAIQIHRGMFRKIAQDPLALLISGTVLGQILMTEQQADIQKPGASSGQQHSWQIARSADGEWISVRHVNSTPAPVAGPARAGTSVRTLPTGLAVPASK